MALWKGRAALLRRRMDARQRIPTVLKVSVHDERMDS
jgi:hypothetical protein